MELKGSQTEKNLLAAFSGESMARNKYLFFAEKAKQENHPEIQELFESMAKNEGMHGKLLFQHLFGIGSTSANLKDAISGEYGEWSSMYPSFAEIARSEGFEEVAMLFDNLAKIERDHEQRFMLALINMSRTGSAPAKAAPSTVTVEGYRCMFCGAVFDHRPDVCDVCGAIGSFEKTTYQKTIE